MTNSRLHRPAGRSPTLGYLRPHSLPTNRGRFRTRTPTRGPCTPLLGRTTAGITRVTAVDTVRQVGTYTPAHNSLGPVMETSFDCGQDRTPRKSPFDSTKFRGVRPSNAASRRATRSRMTGVVSQVLPAGSWSTAADLAVHPATDPSSIAVPIQWKVNRPRHRRSSAVHRSRIPVDLRDKKVLVAATNSRGCPRDHADCGGTDPRPGGFLGSAGVAAPLDLKPA